MTEKLTVIGAIIYKQRTGLGFTLRKLGLASGVSISHIGRIERGERFPSAWILRKLAKPLKMTEIELFQFAGYLPRDRQELREGKYE